jgi:hypothetical protein
VTNNHDWLVIQAGYATDNSRVIGEMPIAVQFVELTENMPDVVKRIRTLRVPGQARNLPAGQVAKDGLRQRATLILQARNFVTDI